MCYDNFHPQIRFLFVLSKIQDNDKASVAVVVGGGICDKVSIKSHNIINSDYSRKEQCACEGFLKNLKNKHH